MQVCRKKVRWGSMPWRHVCKKAAVWLAVCAVSVAWSGQSQAAVPAAGPGEQGEVKMENEVNQAIVVEEAEGFKVTVSYFTKQADGTWKQEFSEPGIYGRNGGTDDKKEGDGKTPYGTYRFTMAFGMNENPGSILPYHTIGEGDLWIDDSDSVYYNKLVNAGQVPKDWNSGEQMNRQGISYNYGLALNYNQECVPGKGSAIFLHCYTERNDSGSAGCIRIPEERMKQLIQSVDENTRIVIRSSDSKE